MRAECSVDGCDKEAKRSGFCWAHVKQKKRTGATKSLRSYAVPPIEKLQESALAYAEAETDEDFERARSALKKAAIALAGNGQRVDGALVRAGMARRRAQGVHVGRPSKVDAAQVLEAMADGQGVRSAAGRLGISERTLRRILRRRTKG